MPTLRALALQRFKEVAAPRGRRYARPGSLAKAVDAQTITSAALEVIDDALVALMHPMSPEDALAIFMAPQEGKSQRVSRRFVEWLLDHNPRLRIGIVSYEMDTALRWGRDIKMDIAQHPCQSGEPDCRGGCGGIHILVRSDSSAAGRWETPQGGGVYCVGVGGPLTGRPIDVLIIDDPVKDRAAAESAKIRETAWDWWESVAITRLAPGARVVLIQTRWHEDDLAGRIASRPSPLKWKTLRIPAIADSADDPLGRAIGEEMVSARKRAPGHFRNLQKNMSPYVFSGVYQQSPSAAEGNFFRRTSFRYWRGAQPWSDGRQRLQLEGGELVTLADCWRFITMDFAASTKSSADYTVAGAWALTPAGDLVLLDLARQRVPDHQHFDMAKPLMDRWAIQQVYVEHNWWSQTFVTDARADGVPVAEVMADTDKVTRAIPAAGRVHAGRVHFPAEAAWLDDFTNELAIFPQGAHDDQVDVLSYAARIVVHDWTKVQDTNPGLTVWETAANQAAESATGSGGDLDISGVPW